LLPASIARAGRWLLDSGVQSPEGGMARYYQSDLERLKPISTEITGYAASAFVFLYHETRNPLYLDAAVRAARFLTGRAWNAELGTFPFEIARNGDPLPPSYFFDLGIIARGLLAVWRTTGEANLLETARRTGESMKSFHSAAAIHPILELPSLRPVPYGESWSRNPGCYQLKSAMAWHELGDHASYDRALGLALGNDASFLPGDSAGDRVMDRMHAYGYYLEGLLPAADRPECASAIRGGIRRLEELLTALSPEVVRSDVIAQLLRIRLLGGAIGVEPVNLEAAGHEAGALSSFQRESDDRRVAGGFGFGRRNGADLPFVNPVSTIFAIQALRMWDQYRAGTLAPDYRQLI
jgi:hypothetical protein